MSSGIWNDANNNSVCDPTETDCVKVAGDSAIYAVYDSTKLCSAAGKGCSRFGQGQGGAVITSWLDVYKQNNPDTYTQTLCQKNNVGCEEWQNSTDRSLSYFKNPGANVCSFRAGSDPANSTGKAWYKSPLSVVIITMIRLFPERRRVALSVPAIRIAERINA